jgi:hypothetical protein
MFANLQLLLILLITNSTFNNLLKPIIMPTVLHIDSMSDSAINLRSDPRSTKPKRRSRRAHKTASGVRNNNPKRIQLTNVIAQILNADALSLEEKNIAFQQYQKQHESEKYIQKSGQQKHHQSKKARNIQRSVKKEQHNKQTHVQNVLVQCSGQEQQQSNKPHDKVQGSELQRGENLLGSGQKQKENTHDIVGSEQQEIDRPGTQMSTGEDPNQPEKSEVIA